MSKFCGVISSANSISKPDLIPEFSDLEVHVDCLIRDTQLLEEVFQRQAEWIQEREKQILENEKQIIDINVLIIGILKRMAEIEWENDHICSSLSHIEKFTTRVMLPTCDYVPDSEHKRLMLMVLETANSINRFEHNIRQIVDCEEQISEHLKISDIGSKLCQFLDCHVKILQNTEVNLNRMEDEIGAISRKFKSLQLKFSGGCLKKPANAFSLCD